MRTIQKTARDISRYDNGYSDGPASAGVEDHGPAVDRRAAVGGEELEDVRLVVARDGGRRAASPLHGGGPSDGLVVGGLRDLEEGGQGLEADVGDGVSGELGDEFELLCRDALARKASLV